MESWSVSQNIITVFCPGQCYYKIQKNSRQPSVIHGMMKWWLATYYLGKVRGIKWENLPSWLLSRKASRSEQKVPYESQFYQEC